MKGFWAILGAAVTACVLAAPAAAETFSVNSNADPGTGACDATECTLREAITAANGNGTTIGVTDQIPINVTGEINLLSELPDITTRTTITGPGPAT